MISKSTIQHLRVPFSFYLFPFSFFSVTQVEGPGLMRVLSVLGIIHFLFYPSSNGYNSYFDKDEESIGGLEVPPPVTKDLLYVSTILELASIFFAWLISWQFALMLAGMTLASRAYSHPNIRLKKYPIAGLFTVAFFQGGYTFLMTYIGISGKEFSMLTYKEFSAAGLCSLLLFGSYPMTQVYQHGEDGRRGDRTISRMLGITGTFGWACVFFTMTVSGFMAYLFAYYSLLLSMLFPLFLLPTLVYFLLWYKRVLKDPAYADYKSAMRLNGISSCCFLIFFIFLKYATDQI